MQPQPLNDWEIIPYSASAEPCKPLLDHQLSTSSKEQLTYSINKLVKSINFNSLEKRFFTVNEQHESFDDIEKKLQSVIEAVKTIQLQHNPNLHALAFIQQLLQGLTKNLNFARVQLNITIMNQIIDDNSIELLLTKHQQTIDKLIDEKHSALKAQNHDYLPANREPVTKQSLHTMLDLLYEQQSLLAKCQVNHDQNHLQSIRHRLTHINQMMDKYHVQHILLNLEYELWFAEYLARPSFKGFDVLFNLYRHFLENLDLTLMYCQTFVGQHQMLDMMNHLINCDTPLSDFQKALISNVFVPLKIKVGNAIHHLPHMTQYLIWRMSAICFSATKPSLSPLTPSDADFYMMVKCLLSNPFPAEKKLMRKSILKTLLQAFIANYPLELLLESNHTSNSELHLFSQLLTYVINPKIIGFYGDLGIDKKVSLKDRVIYLENSVSHWRSLAKKAMDNSKDKQTIRQLHIQLITLTEQLNQLQQGRDANNPWREQQQLFENVHHFEHGQHYRFTEDTDNEIINNKSKSDSVLWEKSF